jgi:hypothetical protein
MEFQIDSTNIRATGKNRGRNLVAHPPPMNVNEHLRYYPNPSRSNG